MGIMGVTVLHNAPGDGATSEHPILEPPWDRRPSPAGSEDPQAIQMFFFPRSVWSFFVESLSFLHVVEDILEALLG